jgi:hypothetical protein
LHGATTNHYSLSGFFLRDGGAGMALAHWANSLVDGNCNRVLNASVLSLAMMMALDHHLRDYKAIATRELSKRSALKFQAFYPTAIAEEKAGWQPPSIMLA